MILVREIIIFMSVTCGGILLTTGVLACPFTPPVILARDIIFMSGVCPLTWLCAAEPLILHEHKLNFMSKHQYFGKIYAHTG